MDFCKKVEQGYIGSRKFPKFTVGDTIAVSARISEGVEGGKSRMQVFQGVCFAIKRPGGLNCTFSVRKVSSGVGVEKVFPYYSPAVEKIEVVQKGKTRRSKLYYLRKRSGKSARISIDYDKK